MRTGGGGGVQLCAHVGRREPSELQLGESSYRKDNKLLLILYTTACRTF